MPRKLMRTPFFPQAYALSIVEQHILARAAAGSVTRISVGAATC
jgi:hypothetical protein